MASVSFRGRGIFGFALISSPLRRFSMANPNNIIDRGPPFRRRSRDDKAPRKIVPASMPRNPLKRLDSDERIQGNPRKSNAPERGSGRVTATSQENPNGSTGPTPRPDLGQGSGWRR